jgi:hypothetical protein
MEPEQQYVDEKRAAQFLGLSPHTLSRWRWSGSGPRFYKFGKAVRYGTNDLTSYAAASARANTSEKAAA